MSAKRTCALAGLLLLVVLVVIGTYKVAGPHARFLRNLEKSPLLQTNGTSGWYNGPAVVRQISKKIGAKGYDLLADYKRNLGNEPVRLSLAYLLLMQESDGFLDYYGSIDKIQELSQSKEHAVWSLVLEDDGGYVSLAYCRRMAAIMKLIDQVGSRHALAKFYLRTGKESEGVEILLDLFGEEVFWLPVFEQLPPARRTELLLPMLETKSARGAAAATVLAEMEEHREHALEYLASLKDETDPAICRARDIALEYIKMRSMVRAAENPADSQTEPVPAENQ